MLKIDGYADSYYVNSALFSEKFDSLTQNLTCDVCVVGAGLAGISCALELAEKGLDVILLEATRIAHAASGRNGGQIIPGYGCDMGVFEKHMGVEMAQQVWDMSLEAVEIIDHRVSTHGIACDWQRTGHVTTAVLPRKFKALKEGVDYYAQRYGYTASEIWGQEQLREELASPRYCGALFDKKGGHLHPLNYALGLAKAARSAGVRIFENSAVRRYQKNEHHQFQIETDAAQVSANKMVLATNVFVEGINEDLGKHIMSISTTIACTEPLGAEHARALILRNFAVADNQNILDYYRLTADHRLLFGARASMSIELPRDIRDIMKRHINRVFPQLNEVKIDTVWGGLIDVSLNRAPHWGRDSHGVYFCQGFSGHGVAVTNLAGKLIAEHITGQTTRLEIFEKISHASIPLSGWVRKPAMLLGRSLMHLGDLF